MSDTVVIVGQGRAAARHAAAATRLGVATRSLPRSHWLGDERSVVQWLREAGAAHVVVAAPPAFNVAYARAAVRAGAAVLVEKPAVTSEAEAEAMRALDGTVRVAHVLRHCAAFVRTRALAAGAPVAIDDVRRARRDETERGWWRELQEGLVLFQMVHSLDLIGWITGAAPRVAGALGGDPGAVVPWSLTVSAHGTAGADVPWACAHSFAADPPVNRFVVRTVSARLEVLDYETLLVDGVEQLHLPLEAAFEAQMEAFLAGAEAGAPVPEALDACAAALSIQRGLRREVAHV